MGNEFVVNKSLKKKSIKDNIPIILILTVSAFLNIFMIWKLGFANKYYAAGVYSMGENLHAFFFNSLDSVGFITIDKPPLGFWIQVMFAKLFGFNGTALILPQSIASVVSVYLLYRIIRKRFSKGAGLVAAAILALTPIFVAVARNNTIDGILILLLILASQQALVATEKSSMKHLVLAGVFIGLGFNVKMLQAFVIVPAIYLTYLIFAKQKLIKRIFICALSAIIMLAISLSWVVIVDMIPEEYRPYIGSSDDNSAINLVIGHNGLSRIFNVRNNPSGDNNTNNTLPNKQNINPENMSNNKLTQDNLDRDAMSNKKPPLPNTKNNVGDGQMPMKPPINYVPNKGRAGGETGEEGIFRLYNEQNAGQISWFVLPAILTCILIIWLVLKNKFNFNPKSIALLYFALCFIPIFIYFSYSSGIAHRYYYATLAPFLAGLVAIGYYYLVNAKMYWIPTVFIPSCLAQLYIQYLYKDWFDFLIPISIIIFVVAIVIMIVAIIKKAKKSILLAMLCALFILPFMWSITPMIYNDNSQLPIAGPELVKQNDKFDTELDISGLIDYLNENRNDATYLAMTTSSMSMGAELILQSGEAVMALGGFNGSDNTLTLDEFIEMINNNDVRYAVIRNNNKNSNMEILNWITRKCEKIVPIEYEKTWSNYSVYKLN